MTLGERIKICRQKAGLSQEQVAEQVGVSRQAVTKWEADRSAPSTENLFKLAEIFGTTVDLLLTEQGEPVEQGKAEGAPIPGKQGWKRNFRAALLVALGYLAVYLVGRILWCDLFRSTLLGWLFTVRPSGEHSYLYGWLLSSNLFWYAMAVSVLPALWGRTRFSAVTAAGFLVGIGAGMLFGPYPEGAALGHGHYGWAIWGAVYLISAAAGVLAERRRKKLNAKTDEI